MKLYSAIEEKFCIRADKNVAVEMIHYKDGTKKRSCLNCFQCGAESCPEYRSSFFASRHSEGTF